MLLLLETLGPIYLIFLETSEMFLSFIYVTLIREVDE